MKYPVLRPLMAVFCFFCCATIAAQTIDVNSCAISIKRSNGNGQANSAPGYFPGYGINNPVAANINGTKYDTVPYVPSTKTGDLTLYWTSATSITNLPVITRVWTTPANSTVTTIASISFGPPAPAAVSGQNYNVKYCFYVQNIPPQGTLTLEFANPQTGAPAFICSYDLQSGSSVPNPGFSCAPTITTQPVNQSLCGVNSASFLVAATGATSYQWQVSNDSLNWTIISSGGNYSNATTGTLTIANPNIYTGKYYRAVVTGSSGCGTTNSYAAQLISFSKPTAQFSTANTCGTGTQSLAVNLTGTAPWTITYNNGGTPVTINNITATPYYLSASGSSTYTLTAVSDAYCSNSSLTGTVAVTLNTLPTVTPSSSSICYGSNTFNLAYTTSGSPDQYSITTGVRNMAGFSAISNAALGASPQSISIPAGTVAGVYDFLLTVRKSSTGCTSVSMPFTVTVNATPVVTASATAYAICSGAATTLSATGASSYSWSPATGLSASNIANPVFTAGAATTFTVTGTAANGCTATGTVSISLKTSPTITVSATPGATVCSGGQVAVNASGGNAYSWSGPSGYTASGNQIILSPSITGTYTVTGTGANGCTGSASQAITVSGGPSLTLTSNVTICNGTIQTLTVSGATTYVWSPMSDLYTDAAATVPYTGTSVATVYARPSSTTTYTAYGTTGSCTSSKPVTVKVTNPITVPPPAQLMYCTADLSGGNNNQLSFGFTSGSSVTCKWEYNTTNTWPGTEITSNNQSNQYSRSESNTTSLTSSTVYIKTPGVGAQYYRLTVISGSCTLYYYTQLISLTGTPAITVSSNQTICAGTAPATLTASGYSTAGSSNPATTFTYKWQSSTDGSAFADIAGTNSTSYSPGVLNQNTWYRWAVVVSSTNCSGTYYSSSVKITIATAVTGNSLSVTDACLSGVSVTGSTPSGGTGSYTYSWESSTTSSSSGFTAVAGATSQSYTPPIVSVTTWFRRLVTSGGCSNSTSTAIAIYPAIAGNQISNGQTVCAGTSLTALTVTPTGGPTGGSFTYQWKISSNNGVSYSDSTGATASSINLPGVTGTRYYQVTITKGACSTVSNPAIIRVNALPNVSVTPTATSVCQYKSTALTASGAAGYTWLPATDLSATAGTTVTCTPSATRVYTITGTDANGCTNTATATINYTAAPSDPSPATLSPINMCSTAGSYTLAGSNPDAASYEWFAAPSNSIAAITTTSTTGTYYVYKKNSGCYSQNYATLVVNVANVSKPVVAATSLSYCAPATADLTALQPASQSNTVLEWHTASINPSSGNLVSSPAAVGNGTYYLYAYFSTGNCYGPASDPVSVNIFSTTTASVSVTAASVCAPGTVNLNSYNNTGGSNIYRWYNTNNPVAASLVSMPDKVSQSGIYYLYATNSNGCTGSPSPGITVTINNKPTATINSPAPVCGNAASSITGSTNASPATFSWETSVNEGTDWSPINNGGIYSGATTNTLSISGTGGLNGNYYRYTVTGAATCSTTSDAAILISEAAPAIITQPVNASAGTGYNTSFSVAVSGNFSCNYQWQVSTNGGTSYSSLSDNSTYTGTTSATLQMTSVTAGLNNYRYQCVISNSCNTLTSNAATLSVAGCTPPVPSFISSIPASLCMNNGIVCTTQSGQNNYAWNVSGTEGADYSITGGSTSANSNTVSITWLSAGVKTVTVNYTNAEGCSGESSASATTLLKQAPAIVSGASSRLIATGNKVVLAVSANNTHSYQWSKDGTDVPDSTGSTFTIDTLTQSNGGDFRLRLNAFSGCYINSPAYSITPSVILYSKSSGNLNNPAVWGVNADGSGSTPVDFSRSEHTFILDNRGTGSTIADLTIAGTLDVKNGNCQITPGTTLTAGIIKRSGTTGTLTGSNSSNLILTGINGAGNSDLYFDPTTGKNIVRDLTIYNSTVNVNNKLNIAAGSSAGTVLVNSGTLAANGNLVLQSDAAGTARIAAPPADNAAFTAGGYITGEVTVERYIPANSNRAWRLLSIPTKGTQTIHEAWQENAVAPANGNWGVYTNPTPGYGTNLTSNSTTAVTGDGYDYKTPSNSLLAYNGATDEFTAVASTAVPIETTKGYFIYLRGDRTMTPSSSTLLLTPAILRTKGTLYQGNSDAINIPGSKYELVGNPFASRIDLRNMAKTGIDNSITVWDPKLLGAYNIGAFQTLTFVNGNYIVSPGGGSYGAVGSAVNHIESGQAFFVRGSGPSQGTVQFTEAAKSTGSSSSSFRPTTISQQLSATLYAVTANGNQLADGNLILYDEANTNTLNADDARKMENFGENFGILRDSTVLAIEKRHIIQQADTVIYDMHWLKKMNYQLVITGAGFSQSNLVAELTDTYTGISTPVNTEGNTVINFTVSNAAGSAAANRFRIVLYQPSVLPLQFISATAAASGKKIKLEWAVSQQVNVQQYAIEKSADGQNFEQADVQPAQNCAASGCVYTWTDANAWTGYNYYRIKAMDHNGRKQYSTVVKAKMENIAGTLFSSFFNGSMIHCALHTTEKGNYSFSLHNINGQLLLKKDFYHSGNRMNYQFAIPQQLPGGMYQVTISAQGKTGSTQKILLR